MKKLISKIIILNFAFIHSVAISAPHHESEYYNQYAGDFEGEPASTVSSSYQNYKMLKKFISKLQSNPSEIFESIVSFINGNFETELKDSYEIRLNYRPSSNQKPIVDLQFPVLSHNNQFTLDIIVDERVKTNEFFKLKALVELNSLFPIFSYVATEYVKKHPSETKITKPTHHQPTVDNFSSEFKELNISMQKSLGLINKHSSTRPAMSDVNYMEVLANARAGSVYSQKMISDYNVYNTNIFTDSFEQYIGIKKLNDSDKKTQLIEFAKANGLILDAILEYDQLKLNLVDHLKSLAKNQNERALLAAQQKYKEDVKKYKSYSETRKQIVENYKLSELVLNNDRAKVAELLNQMLPWDLMEPTEKSFWTGFISAIRKPDYSKSELLYRGLDGDEKMQLRVTKDNQIESAAIFSKRLTAGSGSHFFKLLGLPETFEKFGTSGNEAAKKPFIEAHSVTNMMLNHANNPNGSPFISLSYSPQVAYGFATGSILTIKSKATIGKEVAKYKTTNASGGFVALRIDPRRLLVNSISFFEGELEVLASLLIFPDEIVHLEKGVNFDINIKKDPSVIAQEKLNSGYVYEYENIDSEKYQLSLSKLITKIDSVDRQSNPKLFFNKNNEVHPELAKVKKFQHGLTLIQNLFARVSPAQFQICRDVFR